MTWLFLHHPKSTVNFSFPTEKKHLSRIFRAAHLDVLLNSRRARTYTVSYEPSKLVPPLSHFLILLSLSLSFMLFVSIFSLAYHTQVYFLPLPCGVFPQRIPHLKSLCYYPLAHKPGCLTPITLKEKTRDTFSVPSGSRANVGHNRSVRI